MARASRIFASSSGDKSTTAFHSRTEVGTRSRALRKTRRLRASSSSRNAACVHRSTFVGSASTARAKIARAVSGGFKRAFSIQTSAFPGHASHPRCAKLRAALIFPASSSRRAAAIQPGACFGFVLITDLSSSLAFLTSAMSDVDDTFTLERPVRYPLGSTTVCPATESPIASSFSPSTLERPSPTAVRSFRESDTDRVSRPTAPERPSAVASS